MFGSNVGFGEILIIAIVALVLFGPKKIPEFAQGLGKAMREFKKALNEVEDEVKKVDKPENTEKKA